MQTIYKTPNRIVFSTNVNLSIKPPRTNTKRAHDTSHHQLTSKPSIAPTKLSPTLTGDSSTRISRSTLSSSAVLRDTPRSASNTSSSKTFRRANNAISCDTLRRTRLTNDEQHNKTSTVAGTRDDDAPNNTATTPKTTSPHPTMS
mmetsp:Transcript_25885/g.31312  ORF Transcript_25885/g.31312 Transcript_25885/m.31312 type:complete len:145 (+) Transcript_25885:72-506(+)